jgi:aryl-alcohol dehydrogenase-like predicted oxidoreductase
MTRRVVDDAIGVSLSRMGVECLDLLQFHPKSSPVRRSTTTSVTTVAGAMVFRSAC